MVMVIKLQALFKNSDLPLVSPELMETRAQKGQVSDTTPFVTESHWLAFTARGRACEQVVNTDDQKVFQRR